MALPLALPSPSNFLGVALVINRNRDGPRFVFHYPSCIHAPLDSSQTEISVDHLDDAGDFESGFSATFSKEGIRESRGNADKLARWNYDDHLVTDNGTQVVPWEHVAGFPTKALEGILTPPRAFHKKRFQISLDSVCFVSYPIHVPPSGFWDRGKNGKGRSNGGSSSADWGRNSGDARLLDSNEGEDREGKVSSMTMFSLVFIFCSRKFEAKELLDIMYAHVVREVNKVYQYCQKSGDFIWQECKKIIQLKDRARENKTKMSVLWAQTLAVSSLAASMRDVYEAICRNKIAVLELSLGRGSVGHSVQIPMPFYVDDVQPEGVKAARSLCITTANVVSDYDAIGGLAAFDKCFALLLTDDDDQNIIADLQARGDKAATAMIELVKAAKPTLSFHQIAQLPDIMLTPQQVLAYAQHFIYWRRAIAVPPIHARDVYVMSPNCDLQNLARASARFAQTFPFALPLPDLLAGLSAAPRPYKSFCPTKSLRPAYLRILSWLIRGGWVCQLCTFAYIVVWPEIQYEVEYNLEAEDLARIKWEKQQKPHQRVSGAVGATVLPAQEVEVEQQHREISERIHDEASTDEDELMTSSEIRSASSTSWMQEHTEDVTAGETSQSRPSAAERAAERARRQRNAEKATNTLAERATAHSRKPPPVRTDHPSVNSAQHLTGFLPYIIQDASNATVHESLYLGIINQYLRARRTAPPPASKKDLVTSSSSTAGTRNGAVDKTTEWNERVADMWPQFWKYFDGHTALERIALIEDMKRKDVWNQLSAMSEFLLCVRHW